MKRVFIYTIFILSSIFAKAQELTFGDSTIISLITCSPGEKVYEKFGHTAIRVKDSKNNIDVVFNYGIFNFETDHFLYKFIKGETDYELGVYYTGNFLPSYAERNSIVWEQILNLTRTEKKNLIQMLLTNYQPENRTYRYNFVFDNCATRPRDKILGSIHGYVKFQPALESKTYRQWVGSYVGNETWLKFGIDMLFGIEADHFVTVNESMFLPELLMSEFQTAQICTSGSEPRKLISDKKILVNKIDKTESKSFLYIKPYTVSVILLLIAVFLTVWDYYRHRHYKLFDSIILLITGIGGFIITYMMLFSIHPLVKMNLNILWLNPFNFFIGILIWVKRLRIIMFFYQIFNVILLIGGLFAFALSAQYFNVAVFPIIVLLLLRSTSWFAYLKGRIYKRRSI